MTTYNTGNAIGSSDARDLYDNAENIDNFANGSANAFNDRFGVSRKSIAGMESEFDTFIQSAGYTTPVAYASGIVLSAYNQLIEYSGEFYKLKAGQAPYTTTGTWGTDSAKLVSVGDAALRQELADENGALLVGFMAGGDEAVATDVRAKLREIVSVKDFGATGDGVADDYAKIQNALDSGASAVYFPAGVYLLLTGSLKVPSNTRIYGDGSGVTIIVQPNYYTYDRPTAPYVAANVVDWNAFYMDCGTQNVEICYLSVRGPFFRADGNYTTYPVENWPANNGIHVRGRDYQVRKSLPKTGESSNIRIHDVTVEGFAEDAIQLDNVTNAWVTECNLNRCGRGGVRVYGGLRNWIERSTISHLSPGDYLNGRIVGGTYIGGNRMYGVTFTRVYSGDLSIYRASEWCSAMGNKVRNVLYWKGLDTHGGKHIEFIGNQIQECHIGIGIDKGGFDVSDGIAPPRYITISGNEISRTFPDNALEGDDGKIGPAITMFAHAATDEQIGEDIIVEGNQIDGHGPDDSWGAVVYQNWRGVLHRGNLIKNSRRAAVCIRSEFEGSIDGDYIDNVRATSGLDAEGSPITVVQDGITVEGANCRGRIGDTVFINREAGTLRAMSLANPTSGYGFTISAGHRYMNLGAGSITRVNLPGNDQLGPNQMRLRASGKIQFDGSISGQRGISSVTKTATGTYEVTLSEPCASAASMWPVVSARASSVPIAAAESTSASVVTVYTRNTSNVLADGGFMISVFGF